MGRRLSWNSRAGLAAVALALATSIAAAPRDDHPPAGPSADAASPTPRSKDATASKAAPATTPEPPAELPAPLDPVPELGPEPPALPPGSLDEEVARTQAAGKSAAPPRVASAGGKTAQIPSPTPLASPAPEEPKSEGASADKDKDKEKDADPSFVLPADRLPLGRQSVGLTVDVVAPQVLNINQPATLKVVVKNHGQTEAIGVVVRDELPTTLTFVSSQPEAKRIDALLSWNVGTIPAGSERVITLSVKPTKVGSFDHAATVSMLAGGKSRTMVREPKLKVEQSVATAKVLRGQPVQFKIAVSNPGDGPARNVTVQAKLSPGLKHESGENNDQNLFEQTIEVIGPGERVTLDTLVADTLQRGDQSCLIVAQSPDVVAGSADARSLHSITVVEPELTVSLKGPEKRFTDMLAPYELTLENKGTAPARNVRAYVIIPKSAVVKQIPPGARQDLAASKITWTQPQIDPGEKVVLPFTLRMGGVGLYTVAAEAKADGVALGKDVFQTDVEGLADVNFIVTEKRRVVDVDGDTVFTIKIDNAGSKEATQILVSAALSDNVEPVKTSGPDERQAQYNPGKHEVVFPAVERLLPGKTIELGIKVRATRPGVASCRVYLVTREMAEKIDAVARFTVVPTRR